MKSGFGAGDWLLRSPIFCVQGSKTAENAGVLFAFLCSVKKEQKGVGGKTRAQYKAISKIVVDKPQTIEYNLVVDNDLYK